MKKLICAMLLSVCAGLAHADRSLTASLLSGENEPLSRTVDIDASPLTRFSLQVNYSTAAIPSISFNPTNVSVTYDTITKAAHGLNTGLQVLLATAPAPGGLVSGTTYFAIKITDNDFKLAIVSTDAVAGLARNITSVGMSTDTWTVTPLQLSPGSAGFDWKASNDGTTFSTISTSTQSLVSINGGTGSRLFDFGEFAYKILRFNYTGPTAGAIRLGLIIHAKKE